MNIALFFLPPYIKVSGTFFLNTRCHPNSLLSIKCLLAVVIPKGPIPIKLFESNSFIECPVLKQPKQIYFEVTIEVIWSITMDLLQIKSVIFKHPALL